MNSLATRGLAAVAVALGVVGGSLSAATATAAPAPIPPPAFPIPPTTPHVTFSTEQSRLVATVSGLPRGEKVCLFEGYFGDPWFGSLGVNAWQALYEKYELMYSFTIRSVPKPPGVYPVRITCRMHEHLLVFRTGELRIR